MHSGISCSGFVVNAIAGSQGQAVCEDQILACMVYGMRMFLVVHTEPSTKAGKLSIEAMCAQPTYPEYCGFGEGGTPATKRRTHGVRE